MERLQKLVNLGAANGQRLYNIILRSSGWAIIWVLPDETMECYGFYHTLAEMVAGEMNRLKEIDNG